MSLISVLNDSGDGECLAHESPQASTTYFQGELSKDTFIGGKPIAIYATKGNATCGHETLAFQVSLDVLVEGRGVHRHTDIGFFPSGFYEALVSSSNKEVFAN